MASFNKVILMGNLVRDPALKFLPSQMAVTEFGIACNRKYKTAGGEARDEVTFVDCTAFGKTAELINERLVKGKPIFIEGRLKYDSWTDKSGGKRSRLSVVVENFQFIGGREDGGSNAPAGAGGSARRQAPSNLPEEMPVTGEPQFNDDEIPF